MEAPQDGGTHNTKSTQPGLRSDESPCTMEASPLISPEVLEPAVADPGVGVQRDRLEVGERHEDLLAQRAQIVVVHAHRLHAVFEERAGNSISETEGI